MIFANSVQVGAPGFQILFWLVLFAGVGLAVYRAWGRVNLEVRNPDKHMELERHEAEKRKERDARAGKVVNGVLGVAIKLLKK